MLRCLPMLMACAWCLWTAAPVRAEKNADLKPVLAKPGAQEVQEAFDSAELPKPWTHAKGEWSIQNGTLVGREKSDDMHAAVLTLPHPHRNTILRFSFKLDGASGFNLSFNHAKGHLFRIAVSENALTVTKDKDKKDADSRPQTLTKAAGKFAADQWHTMLVEIQGDRVTVQTDNGVKAEAKEASLNVDKTGYRFVMKNGPLHLDDVMVWRVEP